MFTKIDKAVAAVVGSLLGLLGTMGFDATIDPYMQQMIIGSIVTFLVWLVPNKD